MAMFKRRGGAQVGWVSATWPLAGIEIGQGKLQVTSMGSYVFVPSEVTAVEPVGAIPILSQGIRIHHTKTQYPERVVFYTMCGRQEILEAVEAAGFRVGQPVEQTKRGFPLRWPALVGVLALWNLLFLLENRGLERPASLPGPYTFLALAMMFTLATLLPKSGRLQGLFMRDGRDVGEISTTLRLVQLITGVMLLALAATYVAT